MVAADDDPARAAGFALGTFYPNPTRGLVTVPFALDEPQAAVSVRVLDVTGRLVATLVDGALGAGAHQVQWQSADQPAGIYLVQLRANGQVETGRVVVLR
jgi:flagellar hook assembly protein FlgD